MTLLRMLRAFTRGSQEKNNSPILNFPMSIIIPRSRDKHPENNEHKGPIKPQSWPGHPGGWSWSQHQAQGPDAPVCGQGGAWRRRGKTSAPPQDRVLGQSQSAPWTHLMRRGPGGEAMKIKTSDVHCQQPHRGRCWQLSTSYVLSSLSEHRGVEEEYVVCISQLARSALCFIRWELHRPRLISGLLLPLILHILGEQ